MAEKLGMADVVELLEQNLQEEEMTLNRLKAIASEFDVAEEADEDEEDEEEWNEWDDDDDDEPEARVVEKTAVVDRELTTRELEQRYPQIRIPPVPPRAHLPGMPRDLEAVVAAADGFVLDRVVDMPANNLSVILRRA